MRNKGSSNKIRMTSGRCIGVPLTRALSLFQFRPLACSARQTKPWPCSWRVVRLRRTETVKKIHTQFAFFSVMQSTCTQHAYFPFLLLAVCRCLHWIILAKQRRGKEGGGISPSPQQRVLGKMCEHAYKRTAGENGKIQTTLCWRTSCSS